MARALAAMDEVRKVKSQLTSAQTGIGTARDLLQGMEDRVRAELDQIDAQLAPGDPAGAQTPLPVS